MSARDLWLRLRDRFEARPFEAAREAVARSAALGNEGWAWEDVLPVYREIENSHGAGDPALHGELPELLAEHRIMSRFDLPGVGKNLHGHLLAPVIFETEPPVGPPQPGRFARRERALAEAQFARGDPVCSLEYAAEVGRIREAPAHRNCGNGPV